MSNYVETRRLVAIAPSHDGYQFPEHLTCAPRTFYLDETTCSLAACRISFYGAHISLRPTQRLELAKHLAQHLTVTLELLADLKIIQWHLRAITFVAIQYRFGEIASNTAEYAEHLFARVHDCGGRVDKSLLNFKAPVNFADAPDFASCVVNIRRHTTVIAGFGGTVQRFVDQANVKGDYATASLITDIVSSAHPIISEVESLVPQDVPHSVELLSATA